MSRIGKKPVAVPSGVTATVSGQTVKIKGQKGELSFVVPEEVSVAMESGAVAVNPRSESKDARAKWGMSRSQLSNLVEGVTKGFEKKLEINGVGYRAQVAGKVLKLVARLQPRHRIPDPGRDHDRDAEADRGGRHRHREAEGRPDRRRDPRLPPPEPYKGKGVKYADEFIFRKEGKKK